MDDQRNAKTNAERQRRYRDRKRGGPPRGRWADHVPTAVRADVSGTTRTMLFMAAWVVEHAPEFLPQIEAGTVRLAPTYRRLKREYDSALVAFLRESGGRGELLEYRENGQFRFEWAGET